MDNIVGSNETVWCEVCRKMHEPWEHMCDQRNIRDRIEAFENRIVELEKENARLNAQTVEFNHCPFCDATITLIESNDKKRIAELEKGNAELLARMLVQAREAAETEAQLRAEIEDLKGRF